MACRIVVTDAPQPVQLHVSGTVDAADIATVETAARVALDDGHTVVIDLAVRPVSLPLLRCLAELAGAVPATGRLVITGADGATQRFLRSRGLGRGVEVRVE